MSDLEGDVFRKNTITMRVSREMALDYGLVEPTPQEAAERAEASRVHQIARRASWVVYDAAREALAAITDPVSRTMLDLHHSETIEGPVCEGCDFGGCEAERPEWPCRTVEAIATIHDIALPDPWHLWRRPDDGADGGRG